MSTEALSALATAAGAIITGYLTLLTSTRATRTQRDTERARLDAASVEQAATEWRALYDKLKAQIDALQARVAESERREYRLRRDLDEVWAWIDRGAKPPPPKRPEYLNK